MTDIKATVLGSNGWYDSDAGNTTSILVTTRKYNLILDAGLGITKLENYCDQTLPTYLFISHSHLDHIFGLHALAKYRFNAGLNIFGQESLKNDLEKIICYPFTVEFKDYSYNVKICDSKDASELPFKFELAELRHAAPTVGIRLDIDGTIISYVADTGLCDNCYKLAQDADLLFTECAHPIGQPEFGSWPHLSPENGAKIAKQSNAKQLVLVHFNPAIYPTFDSRKIAEEVARQTFTNTQASYDGLQISF